MNDSRSLHTALVSTMVGAAKATGLTLDTEHKLVVATLFAKGVKTYQAIWLLTEQGYGEDATILTRSLVNLVINALWIDKHPGTRTRAYIDYDIVLKAKLGRKIQESKASLAMPSDLVKSYANQLPNWRKEEKRLKREHGYNNKGWSGKSIRDMARDVDYLSIYDTLYTMASDVEHSSVAAADDFLKIRSDGSFLVSGEPSDNWVDEARGSAQFVVIDLALLADRVIGLGMSPKLLEIQKDALNFALKHQPQ